MAHFRARPSTRAYKSGTGGDEGDETEEGGEGTREKGRTSGKERESERETGRIEAGE